MQYSSFTSSTLNCFCPSRQTRWLLPGLLCPECLCWVSLSPGRLFNCKEPPSRIRFLKESRVLQGMGRGGNVDSPTDASVTQKARGLFRPPGREKGEPLSFSSRVPPSVFTGGTCSKAKVLCQKPIWQFDEANGPLLRILVRV